MQSAAWVLLTFDLYLCIFDQHIPLATHTPSICQPVKIRSHNQLGYAFNSYDCMFVSNHICNTGFAGKRNKSNILYALYKALIVWHLMVVMVIAVGLCGC